MKQNLRLLYLYLFSFVGLMVVVIGSVRLVDLGLKTFIFKDADKYEVYPLSKVEGEPQLNPEEVKARQERDTRRQRQRELSGSASMILIGLPLYLYHWKIIQKKEE